MSVGYDGLRMDERVWISTVRIWSERTGTGGQARLARMMDEALRGDRTDVGDISPGMYAGMCTQTRFFGLLKLESIHGLVFGTLLSWLLFCRQDCAEASGIK